MFGRKKNPKMNTCESREAILKGFAFLAQYSPENLYKNLMDCLHFNERQSVAKAYVCSCSSIEFSVIFERSSISKIHFIDYHTLEEGLGLDSEYFGRVYKSVEGSAKRFFGNISSHEFESDSFGFSCILKENQDYLLSMDFAKFAGKCELELLSVQGTFLDNPSFFEDMVNKVYIAMAGRN